MQSAKLVYQYIKRHRVRYLLGLVTLFVVDLANLFIPWLTGVITDGLADHTFTWEDVTRCLLLMAFLGLVLAVGRCLWRLFLFGAARMVEKELRDDLFAHLETMDAEYYTHNKTGDLMTRFTSDLNAIRMAIGPGAICVFDAVVMTIMVVVQMMTYVNVSLTLLALVPMVVIGFGGLYYGKQMHSRFGQRQAALSQMTDFVQEGFSGIRVMKAFVRESAQMLRFGEANAKTRDKTLRAVHLQAIMIPLLTFVIGCSTLATLVYGGYLTLMGTITLGRFVAFNQYIAQLVWPMLACGEAINTFSQGLASAGRIQNVMDARPEVCDGAEVEEVPGGLSGQISMQNLTFRYPSGSTPALRGIDLDIPAGTTLAVIGRTGSGKTTLASLLLRLYNTEPGQITLDGRDINTIPLHTLRRDIACVPQDNFLFSDTLGANIAFGVEGQDMEAVTRAAEAACIHESILTFPQGYQTVVGERGVTLSGGQKQRSSIARALMKEAPILILDDSLSAVDTDTEEQLLRNLRKNRQGKTTILIAHRISTVQNADRILVLEEGAAAELGTHAELMALGGIYRDMFEKQQLEAALGEQQAAFHRRYAQGKGVQPV